MNHGLETLSEIMRAVGDAIDECEASDTLDLPALFERLKALE